PPASPRAAASTYPDLPIPLLLISPRLRTPRTPLFPYTTLFRSPEAEATGRERWWRAVRNIRMTPDVLTDPGVRAASEQREKVEVDRKSTRLNSSHVSSSYAVFCWKKKSNIWRGRWNRGLCESTK